MIELALLLSLLGLLGILYVQGYLDRLLDDALTAWFFGIILAIVLVVEAFAFFGRDVDVGFWAWLTTGLGMLGTVLGFSLALAGIDVEALQNPTSLVAEIGGFLKMVSFAVDTTLIGLSAALVMAAMDKVRALLHGPASRTALSPSRETPTDRPAVTEVNPSVASARKRADILSPEQER